MGIHNQWTDTKIIPLASVQIIRQGVANPYDVSFSLLEEGSQARLSMLSQDAMGESDNYAINTVITLHVIPNNFDDMLPDLRLLARYTPTDVIMRAGSVTGQSAGATMGFGFRTLSGPPQAATVAKFKVSFDTETIPLRFHKVVTVSMIHSIDILDVDGWSRLFVQGAGWS